MHSNRLDSIEAEAAVVAVASRLLEEAQYSIEQEEIEDTHDLYDTLSEANIDDTLAIGLTLDERLSLAEEYSDDYGFELGEVAIADLRSRIEILAILVIHQLGLERAQEHLSLLEEAMVDHGLSLRQLRCDNPHGWARHFAEREEGPFQVYEYRNLEGEQLHVDLWHYYQIPGYDLYFEVWLDGEDVTPEENRFDAS